MQLLDIGKLRQAHNRFLTAHDNLELDVLAELGESAVQYVGKYPGFKPQTGKTQKATTYRLIRRGKHGGKLLRLQTRGDKRAKGYLPHILEKGSRRHLIGARTPHGLRFKGKDGNWVTTDMVDHPGTHPYSFLRRARSFAARKFQGRMRRGMVQLAKRF